MASGEERDFLIQGSSTLRDVVVFLFFGVTVAAMYPIEEHCRELSKMYLYNFFYTKLSLHYFSNLTSHRHMYVVLSW